MSRTRKIVLIITGFVLVCFVVAVLGIAFLIAAIRSDAPRIQDNSVLVLRVEGSLPDHLPDDPFARRLFGVRDMSFTDLLEQLRKAKADRRIGAILLEINSSGLGWAKAEELRDAIADFRGSGKPVYAYMEYGADKEYYIATACDRIYVMPVGTLFINGLAANAIFLRGALDNLGVYPEFHQIGQYKNAPDALTRREMSDAQREVINALLDDIFGRYVNAVAQARGRSPEDIRALIDSAPLTSARAREAGLIDGASYRHEIEKALKQRLGYAESDNLRLVTTAQYRQVSPESLDLNQGERIAIIYAPGEIHSGRSDNSPFGAQTTGSDTLVRAINAARDDESVRAIVLRVDSPGGSVYASDLIWQAVEQAKQKKPVVVSMGDLAASGGYYIATNANRILAAPSTITGSIGVFAGKFVLNGFYEWVGVNSQYELRGRNAGMFRETARFTESERAVFEQMVRGFYYDAFLPRVAQGRNRDVEYIDSIAQGRVWTGLQARERGLVDEFGGLDRAVEVARELANIPADRGVRRVVFPTPRTFFEQLFSDDPDASGQDAQAQQQRALMQSLPEEMRRVFEYAATLDRMNRGEVMALLPFQLRIE